MTPLKYYILGCVLPTIGEVVDRLYGTSKYMAIVTIDTTTMTLVTSRVDELQPSLVQVYTQLRYSLSSPILLMYSQ